MKKKLTYLLTYLLTAVLIVFTFAGCSSKPKYEGTFNYFDSKINFDMSVKDAYDYLSSYEDVKVTEENGDVVVKAHIYEFRFNYYGNLVSIKLSYGQAAGVEVENLIVSQLGKSEAKNSFEWYGKLGNYDTMAKLTLIVDTYWLTFTLKDEAKYTAEGGFSLIKRYEEIEQKVNASDFSDEMLISDLYFLKEIQFR